VNETAVIAGKSPGQNSNQDNHQDNQQAQPAWRKWISPRRFRFWIIIALLVYTLGGFFGLPWLIERVATKKVSELGRTLTFGDIKVNPFLLTLQMLDTKMLDTDGAQLFSYDDYFFDLQASSLFRWAWTFREIRLTGLQLNAEQFSPGDERFGRLIDAFPKSEEPEPVPEESPQALPRLVIQQLVVNDASLQFTDHLEHGTFDTVLGPVNVEISNLSTLPDQSGQQQVSIKTRAGGEIAWQGSVQLSPLKSSGNVNVNGRILADFDHYVALFTKSKITGEGLQWGFAYQVEQAADQSIGLRVNDFKAGFENWQLFLPEETEPFVALPRLQVSGANLRWPQQTLDIDTISLQQPQLRLVAGADGSLNLDRLLADLSGAETGNEATGEPAPAADLGASAAPATPEWQVTVDQLNIEQAVVQYSDLATEPAAQIGLQDINVSVTGINNQPDASLPVQASLALQSGGTVRFDGQAVVLPEFSTSGKLNLDGMQMVVAQPWVNDLARVTLNAGSLDLDGDVALSPQQPGSYQGSVSIAGLDLNDNRHKEKLTGWKQLSMERVEVDLAANTVKTSEVVLHEPYGRLQIAADHSTNLDGLMIEAPETEAVPEGAAEPATQDMAITVAGFKIDDASLDFSDLTLPLPFAAAIRKMDGTISTLATNSEEPARVDLEGQVNEYGLARINGSLNAWDPTRFSDIEMTFRNLEMERMTPYTIEFAGWEIDAGRMDLDLDYKINKGQLLGANDVVIRELTVGEKVESPSGASLPLKLAVALLKDSNGVIDVDLPVEGDINDPSFKIGGIVWKAIGNLLLKVVTAPFKLLGSLVGVDSEDFGTLRFAAGVTELSPPDREQLVKLSEAMRQRPELQLEVAGSYVVELDKPALQTRQVDERIEQGVAALEGGDELVTTRRRQVMEQMVTTATPPVDILALQQQHSSIPEGEDPEKAEPVLDETAYLEDLRQRLIEAEPVSDAALHALADARADAVVAALAGDGTTPALPLTRLPSAAVEAGDSGEVPLELKVEAGAE
jgi:hypothetical protein